MSLEVRAATSEEDLRTCLRIRWTVFVEEQGVPPSLEVDEHDREPGTVHAIGLAGGVPAAAGRAVVTEGGRAKIGRMAVIDELRGRGLGSRLLEFLEAEARRRGAREAVLWAQLQAQPFYERHGYRAAGSPF